MYLTFIHIQFQKEIHSNLLYDDVFVEKVCFLLKTCYYVAQKIEKLNKTNKSLKNKLLTLESTYIIY